jgi:hypothetical protein
MSLFAVVASAAQAAPPGSSVPMDAITAETSLAPLEIPRLADANDPPYRAGPRGLRMRRRRHPALPRLRTDLPIRAGVVYAIRARTRAQIESTQIVRPRPHRTRGGPVEGARGTVDLLQ